MNYLTSQIIDYKDPIKIQILIQMLSLLFAE